MPSTTINGCTTPYEILGGGTPIVITGGGHEGMEASRPLAESLAGRYKAIIWDRATIGRADVQFRGARDLDLWSDQLAELIYRLDIAPAYLVGASNGARLSMVTALRYPDVVKGMFLYLVTGMSPSAAAGLPKLFVDTGNAAESGGMESVTQMSFWAARIRDNPANAGLLLAMNPKEVTRTMRRWAAAFHPGFTIAGLSDDDLRRLHTPARVLDGTENTTMMRRYSRECAALLPNAELIVDEAFQADWDRLNANGVGQGHYTEAPSLSRLIGQFVQDFEARG